MRTLTMNLIDYLLALWLLLKLSACNLPLEWNYVDDDLMPDPHQVAKDPFEFGIKVEGQSSLTLMGVENTVNITGVQNLDSIKYSGEKIATSGLSMEDAQWRVQHISIDVQKTPSETRIKQPENEPDFGYSVHSEIIMPETFGVEVNATRSSRLNISSIKSNVTVKPGSHPFKIGSERRFWQY